MQIATAILNLVNDGGFRAEDIKRLSIPVRFPAIVVIIFKLFAHKLVNKWWADRINSNLAMDRSFDRPYFLDKFPK